MTIINVNDSYGDAVKFDSVEAMEKAIAESGYELPIDGLKEGVDYVQDGYTDWAQVWVNQRQAWGF